MPSSQIYEHVALRALNDVELVWHNCFMYNSDGSYANRMGKVLRQKYHKYRRCSIDKDLTAEVKNKLGQYLAELNKARKEYFLQFSGISASEYDKKGDDYCHFIDVPNQRGSLGRIVAVFDPDTFMVIKMYTSQKVAMEAMKYLNVRHESEFGELSDFARKQLVKKCTKDPSKVCWGYRWVYMDDLKKGGVVQFGTLQSDGVMNEVNKTVYFDTQSLPSFSESIESNEFIQRIDKENKSIVFSSIREAYKSIETDVIIANRPSYQDFEEQIFKCGIKNSINIASFEWKWVKRNQDEPKSKIQPIFQEKNYRVLPKVENLHAAPFYKEDLVSGAPMQIFDKLEEAYKDFLETQRLEYCKDKADNTNIKDFEISYLNGDLNVDGIRWVRNAQYFNKSKIAIPHIKPDTKKDSIEILDTTAGNADIKNVNAQKSSPSKESLNLNDKNKDVPSEDIGDSLVSMNEPENDENQSSLSINNSLASGILRGKNEEGTGTEFHKDVVHSATAQLDLKKDGANNIAVEDLARKSLSAKKDNRIELIEVKTLQIINSFQSIRAASEYAKISEKNVLLSIQQGTVTNDTCYVFADQKDEVLKNLRNKYKTFMKQT